MSLTDKQKLVKQLLDNGENQCAIARELSISRSTVRSHIKAIEAKGEMACLSPASQPDHLKMTSTTVQFDSEGKVTQEWRRMKPEVQAMEEFIEGLCDTARGKGKATPRRSKTKPEGEDILFEIDLYDSHIGMLADREETLDENYDTKIACSRVLDVVDRLCARANKPKRGLLVLGGDCLHIDNFSNTTSKSKNSLDADSRYGRVAQYAKDTFREVVKRVASICEELEVLVIPGNHSEISEIWLAMVLDAYYCDCKNITVRTDLSPHKAVVWGKNLIVAAHGDGIAAQKWQPVVAAKFPVEWGLTTHRYCHLGHVHHSKVIAPVVIEEQAGLVVEYMPAITATDAWHAGSGYVGNQKGATAFEYSKEGGMRTRFYEPV